jgi:ubiquinone/menaquinone biosynthesis C-methylase UbiE/chorismate mutase
MFEVLNLEQLGDRIGQVDRALVGLMARRMILSLQVEEYKRGRGQKISRPEVEMSRLQKICEQAERLGLNPEFARAVFYFIIDESCKVQLIQLQENADLLSSKYVDDELWHAALKANLLQLTQQCAPTYDLHYASGFYATKIHTRFEHTMIAEACRHYPKDSLALDLGCATGRVALSLGGYFNHIEGYDISPKMIEIARGKCMGSEDKFAFHVADIEEGIPVVDNAASFVVMSLGFASDVQRLPQVLLEIRRILAPGGTALLSFYNAEALLYQWEFIAWPIGLAAEINRQRHCLDVHWTDGKVYSVYARPYTVDQVYDLMPRGLPVTKVTTHPTLCSVLPNTLLEGDEVNESIAMIDGKLADGNMGAYITVLAKKF